MSTTTRKFIYLIYAPEFVYWSAGIQVLHLLQESILKTGRQSYIINHGKLSLRKKRELNLLIRKLNKEKEKYIFISIYPESIPGNPLGTLNVIRWVLNIPGLLGGNIHFDNDIIWAYTKNLSNKLKESQNKKIATVFLPATDPDEILKYSNEKESWPKYDLVYAQKYRALGGVPIVQSDNYIELTRFKKESTSREETLSLLAGARSLHIFENSTLILEAQILGVPVYCYQNAGLEYLFAEAELGNEGISWNIKDTPRIDSDKIIERLKKAKERFIPDLDILLREHEALDFIYYDNKIRFNPYFGNIVHKFLRFKSLVLNLGWSTAFRFIKNYIFRLIFKK